MQPTYEKVPIGKGRPFIFWKRVEPAFPFSWHYHPEYELTLIQRGQGTRVVGDRVSDYGEGDLVLLGPNVPHTWSSRAIRGHRRHSNEAVVLQFTDNFFGPGMLDQADMAPLVRLLDRSRMGLRFTGRESVHAAELFASALELRGLSRLVRLMDVFVCLLPGNVAETLSTHTAGSMSASTTRTVDRIYQYLNDHCFEDIDLSIAAAHFNMTPSTFHRHLKRATGRSMTRLVNELRISHASTLLVRTDQTISEICYQCGYQNLSYFNRRFLELKAMTPRAYRTRFAGAAS
jgi:AraC-like DNA-binding protein